MNTILIVYAGITTLIILGLIFSGSKNPTEEEMTDYIVELETGNDRLEEEMRKLTEAIRRDATKQFKEKYETEDMGKRAEQRVAQRPQAKRQNKGKVVSSRSKSRSRNLA